MWGKNEFDYERPLFKYCVRAHFANMQHEMHYIAISFCIIAQL